MTSLWTGSLGKSRKAYFYRNMYEGLNVDMNKNTNGDLNKNYNIFVSMAKY